MTNPLSWSNPTMNATNGMMGSMGAAQMGPMAAGGGGMGLGTAQFGAPGTAGMGPMGGGGGLFGGGGNGIGLQGVLGIVGTLGSLWNSFQQHKIAREQLSLARETFETNLANQTQTYNTALEDRITSRYHTQGQSQEEAQDYLSEHSL